MTPAGANRRTAAALAAVIAVMAAMAWAAVPLYDLFCRVTGYGGTTQRAAAAPGAVPGREVTVRFDASRDRDMPWGFRPVQREMRLRLGETGLAFYEAWNPTDTTLAGTASYNVTPFAAGRFFTKIDCFCFRMQVLAPGERVEMPVTFFVDPALAEDAEGRLVHTITLSYSFHLAELPAAAAAGGPTN